MRQQFMVSRYAHLAHNNNNNSIISCYCESYKFSLTNPEFDMPPLTFFRLYPAWKIIGGSNMLKNTSGSNVTWKRWEIKRVNRVNQAKSGLRNDCFFLTVTLRSISFCSTLWISLELISPLRVYSKNLPLTLSSRVLTGPSFSKQLGGVLLW